MVRVRMNECLYFGKEKSDGEMRTIYSLLSIDFRDRRKNVAIYIAFLLIFFFFWRNISCVSRIFEILFYSNLGD